MNNHLVKVFGLLVFLLISLASATPATDQDRLAAWQAKCARTYGYQYDTDAMAQCVERMSVGEDRASGRTLACLQRYTFGTPAYNLCISH